MTIRQIQQAMETSNFWLHAESRDANIINEAVCRGYVRRISHTQVEWTDEGLRKLN